MGKNKRLMGVLFILLGFAVGVPTCVWWVFKADFRSNEAQFFNAVQNGDLEWADRTLARSPELAEATDRYGRTPLFIAVSALDNKMEMTARLIELGVEVDARQQNGFTPLYWAAFNGDTDIVDLLLASGATVDAKTDDGETPLYAAAERGFSDIVCTLARHGVDVNIVSKEGRTPLHVAVDNKQIEIVELLIANGVEINPRDNQGRTPMYSTWGGGVAERIEELLRRHGGVGAFGEPDPQRSARGGD